MGHTGQPDVPGDFASTGGADESALDDRVPAAPDVLTPDVQQPGSAVCGNGVLEAEFGEECDDGNEVDWDGCCAGCKICEFQVNGYVENDQEFPSVTTLPEGDFVVAWQSMEQDGSVSGVFAQVYLPDGAQQGTEFQVSSHSEGPQMFPQLSALAGGGFAVVWQSSHMGSSGPDVFAKRYDASGLPQGDEVQLNAYTTSSQVNPAVTGSPDGGFFAVWESTDQFDMGSDTDVLGQFITLTGAKAGEEFLVNGRTDDAQNLPQTAWLGDDRFVIAWNSWEHPGDESDWAVVARLIENGGMLDANEFIANSYTLGPQHGVALAALPDGFVLTWGSCAPYDKPSESQDGSSCGVFAQRFNGNGTRQGEEFMVNTHTEGDQHMPDMAAFADGSFVVVWTTTHGDSYGFDIAAQRFGTDGSKVGAESLINVKLAGYQYGPAVASFADGSFVVVWESCPSLSCSPADASGQDGSCCGVFAQRFNMDGTKKYH